MAALLCHELFGLSFPQEKITKSVLFKLDNSIGISSKANDCRDTMIRARAILWLLALGFAGFGAAYACRPTAMAALTGIALPSAAARVDFMATYGGFQLGFAGFLATCAVRPGWIRVGLLASGCALLGFAVVRFLGILVNGGAVGATIYAGLALEVLGATLAFSGSFWATEHRDNP